MNPVAAAFRASRAINRGIAAVDRAASKSGLNPAKWLIDARWKMRSAAAQNPLLSLIVARAGKSEDLDAKEALSVARATEVVSGLRQKLDEIGIQKLEPEEKEVLSYWLTEGKRINNDPDWAVVQAMDPTDALRQAHPASLVNPQDPRMQKLSDLADEINNHIQDARNQMYSLGQLSDDTFHRFIDGYLRRDYDFGKGNVRKGKAPRFSASGDTPIRPITGTLQRGEQKTVDGLEFQDMQDKSRNLWHIGTQTDPNGNRIYEFYDQANKQQLMLGEDEAFDILATRREIARNPDGTVTYIEDPSVWERLTKGQTFQRLEQQLGQFLDASTRDIAKGMFMERLANDPNYSAASITVNGQNVTKGAEGIPITDDRGQVWYRVPSNRRSDLSKRGSGGAPYGALAGRFITKELHDSLATEDFIAGVNEAINKAATFTGARSAKVLATLGNPTYYGTNFLANTSAFAAYGGRPSSLLPMVVGKADVDRAKALGVINNKATFEDLSVSPVTAGLGAAAEKTNKVVEYLSRVAQAGDDYFRVRLFRDLQDQGYSEDEAILLVRKAFYDPRLQDSALLGGLEATFQPFTKVVNYLTWMPIDAMAERPLSALLAFSAIGYAYTQAEKLAYDSPEAKRQDNLLRRSYARNLEAGDTVWPLKALTQRSLRLGDYDLDLGSISPWARIAPTELVEPTLKQRPVASRAADYAMSQVLRPGTPLFNFGATMFMGVDPSTQRKVYTATDDDRFKAFVETTVPAARYVSRGIDFARGTPNLRDVKDGPAAVFSPLVGIRLRSRDGDAELRNAVFEWNREYGDYRQKLLRLSREAAEYGTAGNQEAVKLKNQEIQQTLDDLNEYIRESQPFITEIAK